jgi:deazaflavin-dependent oxidoreductase (nitroreductase family)
MPPPRPVMRVFWTLHRVFRRLTGGRVGTSHATERRLGTLFLHSRGHRSGRPRVNGLFYLRSGPDFVVVGSNAGLGKDPAWWANLQAEPRAEVEIGGRRHRVMARPASEAEAATLWPRFDAANPDFVAYRARARRPIPVVILEPG